jgi:hypothetical protein
VVEPPLVTCGDEVANVRDMIPEGRETYTAADVIRRLLA